MRMARRPIRPLVLAALGGALVTWALMGGQSGHSSSSLPAQNAVAGLVNSIRVGDPGACEMLTGSGQRDLVRLLGATQIEINTMRRRGFWVCGTVLTNASAAARARAMHPFLGIIGLSTDSRASGGYESSDDDDLEWNQTTSGTYAVIALHHDHLNGWRATSLRIQNACIHCS